MLSNDATALPLTPVAFASATRCIGYIMVLAGLAYIAQGVVVGAEGLSNGPVPGLLGFVFDLAWMIWLVIMAWQRPSAAKRLATAPITAS